MTEPDRIKSKSRKRLYIGNLSSTIDEYVLAHLFTKYGKIVKLDVLYHTAGPLKGKPRGYGFVEFEQTWEAERAQLELHDKLIRGRKLIVSWADNPDTDERGPATGGAWRHKLDGHKPTTLSLIKNQRKPKSTDAAINALEAKLASMRPPTPEPDMDEDDPVHAPVASTSRASANLPARPSALVAIQAERDMKAAPEGPQALPRRNPSLLAPGTTRTTGSLFASLQKVSRAKEEQATPPPASPSTFGPDSWKATGAKPKGKSRMLPGIVVKPKDK
ncbi:uncharacterized protein L969DRAFT_91711 [Mixia osmundae IAM 14324]|uniref:Probable RNA-binding protein 18 n=1 Tax=Mixia osmundae (strain CBS 9802 / IAM 14324 / JCM 22182 / KY 12970) TaxID=764103 RepID=G7E0A3_MIXOS|nr:uncharacterized protein L969DRAFT_91711 [Mixia osmundae IAM 14324]KEI42254.1 hypothetical protein L969DRAFT_91711 [Mixia osmundae IAM 14324]GAA96263.1 hypothetical protein E5Q_02928 [Mixia osmundae IAM 14324]